MAATSVRSARIQRTTSGTVSLPTRSSRARQKISTLRDFTFSTVMTFQSPDWFTKYAGFDANGDVFGNNDRVGSESRNTFRGDSLQTIDIRLERTFPIRERFKLQLMFEAFNLFNTVNVKYYNTSYGAADFCPFDRARPGARGRRSFSRKDLQILLSEHPAQYSIRGSCSLPRESRSSQCKSCICRSSRTHARN